MAMRNLLSTLNGLAQSGLMASGWLRQQESDAAAPIDEGAAPPWEPYTQAGVEPPLEELLHDPVICMLMRADRLEPEQVRKLLSARRG
jgi:hypothetical protein